jgi:hypothetical protein
LLSPRCDINFNTAAHSTYDRDYARQAAANVARLIRDDQARQGNDIFQVATLQDFTADTAAFNVAVGSLVADGGCDSRPRPATPGAPSADGQRSIASPPTSTRPGSTS